MRKKVDGRTVVLDFDDLCDTNDPWEPLQWLKDRDPGFKVTLFAIPTRCSDRLLTKYADMKEWVDLAIHGWRHSRHECLAWTAEETSQKIGMSYLTYPDFAPVFKAPNWEICDEVYAGLKSCGVAVADHLRNIEIIPADMPHYIYNVRLRSDTISRHHGHIQSWAGTGLTENPNGIPVNSIYAFPIGTRYEFVRNVITDHKTV